MATTGEVHEISGELEIEWRIKNFSLLYKSGGSCYSIYETSPFYFAGTSWKITLSPEKVDWTEKTVGEIKLGLKRLSFGSPTRLEYAVGVKTVEGRKEILATHTHFFPEHPSEHTLPRFLPILQLEEGRSEVLPSDVLTLTCSLKNMEPKDITKSCLTRMLDVVDNIKKMVKPGNTPDLMLTVERKKFHVHRMVLESQSPFFADMFSLIPNDNRPAEVDVEDIDYNTMDIILLYMYTGDIDELTTENVLSVYTAADKFDVIEVKQICSNYIRRNLSVEWVCDVIKYAERQKAGEISRDAREYFFENASLILKTNHWKTFLKENRDIGVELLSSAVEKLSINCPSDTLNLRFFRERVTNSQNESLEDITERES